MRLLAIMLMCVFMFAVISAATTIVVPDDQPTIQLGLNAANSGDTVLVLSDTYYENLYWPPVDSIVLLSDSGAARTIIDGNAVGRVIEIRADSIVTSATVINGFTIQNGYVSSSPGPGAGIADFCGVTIINNIIKDNTANGIGGGLELAGGNPIVRNNLITGNITGDSGGGIVIMFADAIIQNNTIVGNSANNGTAGGGIFVGFATAVITDNIITGNSADNTFYQGGGIYNFMATLTLDYNDVWNNTPNNYAECGPGAHSISADPEFITVFGQPYFLDQLNSPCINFGSRSSSAAGLDEFTTSPDLEPDTGVVDMGFHYNPRDFLSTEPITDLVIQISGNDVILSWSAMTGALSYNIYRGDDLSFTPSPVTLVGTTSVTQWTDTGIIAANTKSFYVVTVEY